MKRSLFSYLFVVSLLATAAMAQTVTINQPAAGATVGSPVQVVASAASGSYKITAMRVYVDSAAKTTVSASSISTSVGLAAGKHYLTVVAWNAAGQSAKSSMYINVGSAPAPTPSGTGSISVASPANGATVGSPAHFVASASAPSGRLITAMRIYVDYNSVYLANAAALDTYVNLAAGSHNTVVQAWDNTGAVYKSGLTVNVGGSTPAPPPTPVTSGPYQNNLTATSNWIANNTIGPDGAILYGSSVVNPYYSNLAASGMVKDPNRYGQVQNWMKWYIRHLNTNDRWGLTGTTYDYNYSNGAATSTGNADSTDSYAATFLSLAWDYYRTGDPNGQAYVKSIAYQLDLIGGVLIQTQQGDGLTWAKPDYQIKYLMDNCEAYRGLRDVASLFQAIGDAGKASYYNAAADSMYNGILGMWMNGKWAVYKDYYGGLAAPNMSVWYADASAQLFPVLYEVIPGSDSRAQQAYAAFNAAWPGWTNLSFSSQDEFPWVMIADAAALMGDTARANAYINTIQQKYVSKGFPWTWYNMEAGWFMRLNAYMMGQRPF